MGKWLSGGVRTYWLARNLYIVGCLTSLALASCTTPDSKDVAQDDERDANVSTVQQAIGLPPINSIPSPQTVNEDSVLRFDALDGNALSVSDGDNTNLTVQVIVTNGRFLLDLSDTDVKNALIVTGQGTSSVTASGPILALNAALNRSTYTPNADYNGSATLQLSSNDSNGESDIDILAITVTAFNDPPVNIAPLTRAATEDVPTSFVLSVTDVDVAGAPMLVTLNASNATLITLATTNNLTFSSGDGVNDATMAFSGTLPDINAALNGVVVGAPLNFIGTSTLIITSNDQGASGAGIAGSDADTVNITWAAVNDAPVATVPGPQTIQEEATLTFAGANALTVDDVDATTAFVQVTLATTGGTLSLGNPAVVSYVVGDGVDDATMTFSDTLANVNTALASTLFRPAANRTGAVAITLTANDLGNSGSGGAKQVTGNVTVNISAQNDAPVNEVPSSQTTSEDVARIFSTAGGNAILVSDVDASTLQVTLTSTGGAFSLGSVANLAFTAGDGTADALMTFNGTVAAINAALNNSRFTPNLNFAGVGSVAIVTSDLGATGAGGTLTDTDTISITVNAGNDPPDASNDALVVAEDSGATAISVLSNDAIAPDAGETLSVTTVTNPLHGVATTNGTEVFYTPTGDYAGTDSFSYSISDGNGGTDTATISVTVTSVNDDPSAANDAFTVTQNSASNVLVVLSNDSAEPDAGEALAIAAVGTPAHGTAVATNGNTRISYTPEAGYSGSDSFSYTISDGNGGFATAQVAIDVVSFITAPVNAMPGPQAVVEDSPLLFGTASGNALSVSDANNTSLTVQIIVTNGTFTLSGVAGLAQSGNGTASVTATGTVTALNIALNGARYTPNANYFGAASLTMTSSDSNGENDLDVLNLSVTSVNDPPTNVAPATAAAVEDTPQTFVLSVTDVDLNGAELLVTLTANNGTVVSLASLGGLTFVNGDGATDASMTFRGSLPSVNAALNGLAVTAPANFIGASTLVFVSNDQGASGSGGAAQDSDTISITWGTENDPPVNGVPTAQAIDEDTSLVFADANGNRLTVSDQDVSAGNLQVTLTAANGKVTLGNPGLVTFSTGDGTQDATMTFRGSVALLNSALDGTTFVPDANFKGSTTLTVSTSDLGNTGTGGAKLDTDIVAITVASINDAPINTLPANQTVSEDVVRVFSAANGNAIAVTDSDATSVQVSLIAANGTVSLVTTASLTFQSGDGTADATMTFIGTLAAVNAALNGTSFTPAPNFNGAASLTIQAADLGASGAGGPLDDADVLSINVLPINDAPDAANDALVVAEDSSAASLDVRSNDTFAPDAPETLTITAVSSPLHGTATHDGAQVTYTPVANYVGTDSFTYTISDGNGGTDTATVSVTVTSENDPPVAQSDNFSVNANSAGNLLAVLTNDSTAPDTGETLSLASVGAPANGTASISGTRISYTPNNGFTGTDTLTYTVADGNGGSAVGSVTIDVVAVVTRPINTLPGPQTIVEDSPLVFATANGNGISVSDANNTSLSIQIIVTNGLFTLGSTSGITQSGNGTSSVNMSGTIAALNTALTNARFNPTANYNGPAQLTINTSDTNGESDLDVLVLSVSAFNDPPVNSVTASVAAVEDTPKVLNLSVSDPDLSGADLLVQLTANNGTLISLPSVSGLVFSQGDGVADATMTFTGALSAVNTALNGLSVTAPNNYIGPSTLVLVTNDQGGSGSGPAGQDSDTITITWATDNDPPINRIPTTQIMDEDATLTFSSVSGNGISVSDQDISAGNLLITLAATNGRVSVGDPGAVTFTVGDGLSDTTMTFRGTIAAVLVALEGTTFVPNANFAGAATFTMTSNDQGNSGGAAKTDVDVVAITVNPVNDAPVITGPVASSTNEDVTRIFSNTQGNLISLADIDATALQVTMSASGGTLSLGAVAGLVFQAGDGTSDTTLTFTGTTTACNTALNGLRYIPTPNTSGTGAFTLQIDDLGATGIGGPRQAEQTVVMTIVPTNDLPDAVADTINTFEDVGLVDLDVLSNDSIVPDVGEQLVISSVSTPLHGTATITGGGTRITYAPAGDYNGSDTLTYTVNDGNGGTDTATVTLQIASVNDAPTAISDSFSLPENSVEFALNVRSNDSIAPDTGETLTIISVAEPAHGTAVIAGGGTTITYTPEANYHGPDSLMYTIDDGLGGVATASVTLTVTSVNTVPNAVDDALTVAEDESAAASVLANDTGTGDSPITVAIATLPLQGTAEVLSDNTVRYVPAANYVGNDSFAYTITDVDGESDTGIVAVTVTAVDDVPTAANDEVTVDEDVESELPVFANDLDLVDLPLVVTIETSPEHGDAVVQPDGTIHYTSALDYNGPDTLVYRVTDSDGDVVTATVEITVAPVNDTPTPVNDVASTRPLSVVRIEVLANDTDVDGDDLTVESVEAPANGTTVITTDGAIEYTPADGFADMETFTYTVTDPSGAMATAQVTVAVGLDTDEDGLFDLDEIEVYETDPTVADTDGDLLDDGIEVLTTMTNPLDDDGDDDGLLDGNEDVNADGQVQAPETSATNADSDNDGLIDGLELGLAMPQGEDTAGFAGDQDPLTMTDPNNPDTDGGGLSDGVEDANKNGRVDAGETNPNRPLDDVPDEPNPPADSGGGGCNTAGGSGGASMLLLLLAVARRRRRAAA